MKYQLDDKIQSKANEMNSQGMSTNFNDHIAEFQSMAEEILSNGVDNFENDDFSKETLKQFNIANSAFTILKAFSGGNPNIDHADIEEKIRFSKKCATAIQIKLVKSAQKQQQSVSKVTSPVISPSPADIPNINDLPKLDSFSTAGSNQNQQPIIQDTPKVHQPVDNLPSIADLPSIGALYSNYQPSAPQPKPEVQQKQELAPQAQSPTAISWHEQKNLNHDQDLQNFVNSLSNDLFETKISNEPKHGQVPDEKQISNVTMPNPQAMPQNGEMPAQSLDQKPVSQYDTMSKTMQIMNNQVPEQQYMPQYETMSKLNTPMPENQYDTMPRSNTAIPQYETMSKFNTPMPDQKIETQYDTMPRSMPESQYDEIPQIMTENHNLTPTETHEPMYDSNHNFPALVSKVERQRRIRLLAEFFYCLHKTVQANENILLTDKYSLMQLYINNIEVINNLLKNTQDSQEAQYFNKLFCFIEEQIADSTWKGYFAEFKKLFDHVINSNKTSDWDQVKVSCKNQWQIAMKDVQARNFKDSFLKYCEVMIFYASNIINSF